MNIWSKFWKASKKPGKQRKYRANAPIHVRRSFVNAHLSSELKKKYGKRSVGIVTGDKVKVMRGQFKKHEGKVEKVDVIMGKIYVAGIEVMKKDGNKTTYPIEPSNLMIMELKLDDKKRNEILARK